MPEPVSPVDEPHVDIAEKLAEMQREADKKSYDEKMKKIEEEEEAKPHHIEPGIPLYLETAKIIFGNKIGKMPKKISDIHFDDGRVAVWGDVLDLISVTHVISVLRLSTSILKMIQVHIL